MDAYPHRTVHPDNLGTIRRFPVSESGVLEPSIMYLHLPSDFARSALFYAPYIGRFFCNEYYAVRRTNFDYYLCLLIDCGTLFVQAEGKNFQVEPQNILLLNCKKPHIYYAKSELSFRFFHFDGASSRVLYDRLTSRRNVLNEYDRIIIENAFTALIALAGEGYQNEGKISARIHLILGELLSGELSSESLRSAAVARSISFMEHHFLKNISVKDIASAAYYSEYHFSRLFKNHTGLSPHVYLQNLRVAFARQLLSATDMPVELVSEKCGFNSPRHFIRTFKQRLGCTPSAYRKKTHLKPPRPDRKDALPSGI